MRSSLPGDLRRLGARVATRVTDSRARTQRSRARLQSAHNIIWASWRTLLGQRAPIVGGADDRLALIVRDRLRAGMLPLVDGKVIARLGSGGMCLVCDKPIVERQIEYVPRDATRSPGGENADGICAHQACYAVWLTESQLVAQSGLESL